MVWNKNLLEDYVILTQYEWFIYDQSVILKKSDTTESIWRECIQDRACSIQTILFIKLVQKLIYKPSVPYSTWHSHMIHPRTLGSSPEHAAMAEDKIPEWGQWGSSSTNSFRCKVGFAQTNLPRWFPSPTNNLNISDNLLFCLYNTHYYSCSLL